MAKDNSIDTVAHQRAHERLMRTHVYAFTDAEAHYRRKGEYITICGETSTREFAPADKKTMPLCEKCDDLTRPQLAQWKAEEIRNYWRNPTAGKPIKAAPVARKTKSVSGYRQLNLPPEFMPTGTGRLLRDSGL